MICPLDHHPCTGDHSRNCADICTRQSVWEERRKQALISPVDKFPKNQVVSRNVPS